MKNHSRTFEGQHLLQIAMPMGGIGAGCVCLNGSGGLQDFSIRHRPATSAGADGHEFDDAVFGVLHIKGEHSMTKLLEGPLPIEKIYDQGLQAQGYRHGGHEGLPRFERCSFEAQYPFGRVCLEDDEVPLQATLTGWSPFIPLDDLHSGLPCAILEYEFHNRSEHAVEWEFSFHSSHLAVPQRDWNATRNAAIQSSQSETGGGFAFRNTRAAHEEAFGSAAVYAVGSNPQIKTMWFRGGWFDALSVLWREVSSGQFQPNDLDGEGRDGRNGASLLLSGSLAAGESVTCPIMLTWHFPNSNQQYGVAEPACASDCDCDAPSPSWRPFYAGKWRDASEVALYVAQNYQMLRGRTQSFADALGASTLPPAVLDAVSSNLAILKSPTVLRQENGNVWAWEGCHTGGGCCHGTCTHVWNYAQALPHLFPALERTLREQELQRSIDERGHVQFRAALPDNAPPHDHHAAADGQLGGILKLWRDYHICGDREWLRTLYPNAQKSLDFCIQSWDPQRKGGLFEPHHNTYDIEFWGPDGMCGTIYVAALSAFADLSRILGHHEAAQPYEELAQRGARFLDDELFNGEYYAQKVLWQGLRDTSFATQMEQVADERDPMLWLQKQEGPKYQYGSGCLADGVIGAWMSKIYGLQTPLNNRHVQSTLKAIWRHNFKSDLFDHACIQRPGYALGHEPGLLLCTWPRGGKPTLPFVYSDEVWTGIEYQVASHLIEEGLVDEGLTLVRAVRSRYEGHVRNPFNEYECGSYYARALSSYALLASLSGFRYSAATKTLCFGPKISHAEFQVFFCTQSGFGMIGLQANTIFIQMIEGELTVERVLLTRNDEEREIAWNVVAEVGQRVSIEI